MINLALLSDYEPEESLFLSHIKAIADTQDEITVLDAEEIKRRKVLMAKGGFFSRYRLNDVISEISSQWPEDECIIPSLRPEFFRLILEIESMCMAPEIDADGITRRLKALNPDDLDYVKETEEFLDAVARSKY